MSHGVALPSNTVAFHHRRLPRAIAEGRAMSEFSADRSLVARVHWQRLGLLAAFLFGVWLFFHLFSSILLPFVVAAGLAYFLDPAVSRLEHLGVRRWLGALVLLFALGIFVVLFILQLYPVIADQAAALA